MAGCTTPKNAPAGQRPAAAPKGNTEWIVIRDFTPFFSLGPAQPSGPDLSLRNGERVILLKKEWGFSRVQISDGRQGYVDNDGLAPAPPEPKPLPETAGGRGKRNKKGEAAYQGEQVNDVPLPDVPPPNLNIAPEDAPDAAATPTGTPPNPSFRY